MFAASFAYHRGGKGLRVKQCVNHRYGLSWPIVTALIAVPIASAFLYWFVCDDAFITFRFVRNWLQGDGLVWNHGEYVEGYTNFLWAVELAGLWSLG